MGRVIKMANGFLFFSKGLLSHLVIHHMMMKKVIESKPPYILEWINSLDGTGYTGAKEIQSVTLDMLNNPKDHTCLSEHDIEHIFGRWGKGTSGGGFGEIKPIIKNIREKMFVDDKDPNCP